MRKFLSLVMVYLLLGGNSFAYGHNSFNGAGIQEVTVNLPEMISSETHKIGQIVSGYLRKAAVNEYGHVVALDGARVDIIIVYAVNCMNGRSQLQLQVYKILTRWGEMEAVETEPVIIRTKERPATTYSNGRHSIRFKVRKARN